VVRDALLSLHDDDAGARELLTHQHSEPLNHETGDVVKIIARLRAHVPQR
jgi:hypothetical protein